MVTKTYIIGIANNLFTISNFQQIY